MDQAEIYGLYCPETGELRYIGKANNSKQRLKSHLRDSRRRETPVYCWMRALGQRGLVPGLRVLCVTDDWRAKERALIQEHRLAGARLLNVADGGDEPLCPHEVRAANGAKNARELHADPVRRRMWFLKKQVMTGAKQGLLSEEARLKLRALAVRDPGRFSCFAWI